VQTSGQVSTRSTLFLTHLPRRQTGRFPGRSGAGGDLARRLIPATALYKGAIRKSPRGVEEMHGTTHAAAGGEPHMHTGLASNPAGPTRPSVREHARGAALAAATSFALSVLVTVVLGLLTRAAG
jgi:hypothetical protein